MAELITPPGGNTPQAQSANSLAQALATVTGMAPTSLPDVTPQQVGNAQATASQFSGQEKQNVAQATQSLQSQAGVPQLQNQQQNLGKIFQLYLADQNLSQKYSGAQLASPNSPIFNNPNLTPNKGIYTGDTSSVPNPYLAKPSDLINAVVQPSGQGFQGFTTPGLNTQAIGAVPQAAQNMMDLLQSALGQENQLIAGKTQDYTQAYESQANLLQKIADIFQGVYQSQQAAKSGGGSGFGSGSTQEAGSLFNDIIDQVQQAKGGKATERDIWNYINQHDSALRAQGVNVDELWKLHKDLASKVGTGGLIEGGKTQAKYQAKKLPDGTMVNYDPNSGKYYDPNTGKEKNIDDQVVKVHDDLQSEFIKLKNAWNKAKSAPTPSNVSEYNSQKQLMSDKLYYALTKSRAYQGAQKLVANLPNPLNPLDTLGGGGEGKFSGFEQQLNLDASQAVGSGNNRYKIIKVQ